MYTPNPPKIHISQGGNHWIPFPKGQEDHHRSMDKEQGKKSPFALGFLPWVDSLPAWLRLGRSLTVTIEEREHHVAHVIRELHLGHCSGHLLHGHCNRGRAQGHTGLRMCQLQQDTPAPPWKTAFVSSERPAINLINRQLLLTAYLILYQATIPAGWEFQKLLFLLQPSH